MSIAGKLAPSKLEEDKHGVLQSVAKPIEELAGEEKELHARTMTAVDKALRSHGVSLTGSELTHVAAQVADFVNDEISRAISPEEVTEEEQPKKKTKRRTSDD